jgi:predicted Zn-dependent protease
MRRAVAIALIIVLAPGCAGKDRRVTIDDPTYINAEAKLGAEIHRQITETFRTYTEPTLNAYVQSIGHRIAAVADRKKIAYKFIVLDDGRAYATHAPGGYVYVTTGMFSFLVSEIELAGILSHEIGALQRRDPALSKTKKVFERLIQTGSYIGPAFGSIGALSVVGLMLVGMVVTREKSLEDLVVKADQKALQYLVKSGFDPQGLVDPLHRMQDPTSTFRPYMYDYLKSHPITDDRLEQLDREFSDLEISDQTFQSGLDAFQAAAQSIHLNS